MSLPPIDRNPSRGVGAALLDYLRVLYRRRWLALAVLLTVVLSVAAYIFTTVPQYRAQVSILIELQEPNVVGIEEVFKEGTMLGAYYQTQYELLQGRPLVQRTVTSLQLWKRPNFGAPTDSAAVDAVLAKLRIVPVRNTRIVNVQFESPDPDLAAEVANEHARQYVEQSLENRFRASKEATDWLDKQLAEERKRVQATESALQVFREQHDAVSLESGQNIVVQKLADLNGAVTRAKTARIEKEAAYRELQAVEHDPSALDSFPAILSNTFIQQLKGNLVTLQREYAELSETLGERHPTLIEKRTALQMAEKRLAAEVNRVVESVQKAYQEALAEETTLTRALEEQKREALALNRRGIEYAAMQREAESVRLVYQTLLRRAKETSVSRDLRATNISIVNPARPPRFPVSPRTTFDLLMSLATGTLLALGAAFLVEMMDDRIKTPDDVRSQLGLAFLGLVPEVRSKAKRALLLQDDVPVAFVEAFRALRTSLMSSVRAKGPLSIVVTSPAPDEGKTLVACNLAITLAQVHQRVLLVDADLRRPSVHTTFGHKLEPGLSNVLSGDAVMADVLRPTAVRGLTILSAGTPSLQAPELLGSATFTELFAILQEHFDWVIVDSPPVLTVTDGNVVGRLVTGILLVVGSGMTRARAARIALEELERTGSHVLGTVLNRADLEHHPFYFSPYSYGEYFEQLKIADTNRLDRISQPAIR